MSRNGQTGGVIFVMLLVLIGLAVLVAGYFWFFLTWNYSAGERAGWVQKLSKKGWVCKTWEGELSMVSMPGTTPEKFLFTVRDDAVAEAINKLIGQRVSLHYEEKVGLPTSCFGDTRHFVTKVTAVDQTPLTPGSAAGYTPSLGAVSPDAPGMPVGSARAQWRYQCDGAISC